MSMTPPPPLHSAPRWMDDRLDDIPALKSYLYVIGDIGVTQSLVVTPVGTCALRQAAWTVTDRTSTRTLRPRWSKILAIGLGVTGVGLLFLRVHRRVIGGYISITVEGGAIAHTTAVPIDDAGSVEAVKSQIRRVEALASEPVEADPWIDLER